MGYGALAETRVVRAILLSFGEHLADLLRQIRFSIWLSKQGDAGREAAFLHDPYDGAALAHGLGQFASVHPAWHDEVG